MTPHHAPLASLTRSLRGIGHIATATDPTRRLRSSMLVVCGAVTLAAGSSGVLAQDRGAPAQAGAQALARSPAPGDSTVDRYARANIEIARLRDSLQAALADFRRKKPDEQAKLRVALVDGSKRILGQQGLTEQGYRAFLMRISTEDTLRLRFDSALVRLAPRP